MSREPSNSEWVERSLESARRRVTQLEIDAYRIRTDLAQIEAANATGMVVGEKTAPAVDQPVARIADESQLDWKPIAEQVPDGMELLVGASPQVEALVVTEDKEQAALEPAPTIETKTLALAGQSRVMRRRTTSPFMASLAAHAAIMIAAVSITVATIEGHDAGSTTTLVLGDKQATEAVSFEPHQLADLGETGVQNVSAELPQLEALSSVDHEPIPIEFSSIVDSGPIGEMGLDKSPDTEPGNLPSGVGGLGKEGNGTGTGVGGGKSEGLAKNPRKGGRAEQTLFFGTAAKGNRFVFVVDNSSSMKGGRLQMAVAELIRTVNGLSAQQSFYVIFVSDKTYAMFYPQHELSMVPATPENKKRLTEWAPKAILASGKNRELIKAMDLAASLEPQAVYLLWDGDMRNSEDVRLDVMTHLTEPNQWKFIVHTLGMGVTSPNSEQNLRTIAQAHHGTFRRIDVPGSRAR